MATEAETGNADALVLSERQRTIVELVRERGVARSEELAEILNVSGPTVRRDITALHERGLLARFHGGVREPDFARLPFAERRIENNDLKRSIALEAIRRIPAGSNVFLETGTTIEIIAREFPTNLEASIVTTSIFVAVALAERPVVNLYVLGGHLRGTEGNLSGYDPIERLAKLRFDIAIIGFSGIDQSGTPMDYDVEHRPVKALAIENAQQVIAVADHTKFGVRGLIEAARWEDIDTLITTGDPPADIADRIRGAGVEVVVV